MGSPEPGESANASSDAPVIPGLGTYVGVFRPTVLTIIGVILYLREGWVVGHAGLLGGLLIVLLTFGITGATALSFSAITTNIRIGAGGAFALVAQSLGLEAGGAIGIPLYLAQALSAAFYMYGFAEGWHYLFPEHHRAIVLAVVFAVGFGLSVFSERLALYMQAVVMIGVIFAIGCMWAGALTVPTLHVPQMWGEFSGTDFWLVFAVFFPSGTGIMVGVALSGKLDDPRKSIPRGILGAWGAALAVYVITAIWLSVVASQDELVGNYTIAVDRALWGPGVLVGLMSSCLSAMLGSIVAAPNVLQALGKHRLVPGATWLARTGPGGTPRIAVGVTGVIVALTLTLGTLDRVAEMITMFFLITYATINIVVLVEQALDLISFRPSLKIPFFVPFAGAVSAVFAMVIIHPAFGLTALGVVVVIYLVLVQRHLETPWETVRSGLVVAVAEWVGRVSQNMTGPQYRAWKPDLLAPVTRAGELSGEHRLLRALVRPRGSVQIVAITEHEAPRAIEADLDEETEALRAEGILANRAVLSPVKLVDGVRMATAVLTGSFHAPNCVFVNARGRSPDDVRALDAVARERDLAFALYMPHVDAGAGREQIVNVWVPPAGPEWHLGLRLPNLDLALLFGYQLSRNWGGAHLRLVMLVEQDAEIAEARAYLGRLAGEARLPHDTEIIVESGSTGETVPHGDVNLIPLAEDYVLDDLRLQTQHLRSSCLFLRDSTHESALA